MRPLPVPGPAIIPGLLTARDFTSLETSVAPVIEGPALVHRVPDGRLYRLGSPFNAEGRQRIYRLLLGTGETFLAVMSTAGGVITVTMPARARITSTPDLPGTGSIRVATRTTGDWTLRPAAALTVDYVAQTVAISGLPASTAHDVHVYGLIGDPYSRVQIVIERAGGGSRRSSVSLAEIGLAELHEVSQVRGDQIPHLDGVSLALPADEIRVTIRSTVRHLPPQVLMPGALSVGHDLERVEFRPNTTHLAGLLGWVQRSGIPTARGQDLIAHLRAAQDGDMGAALGEGWRDLPFVRGLAVE